MTARTLLKLDGSDIRQMTSGEMSALQTEAIRLYGAAPTAVMTQVSNSGAGFAAIVDTRLQAGAAGNDNTNFDTQGETADVSTVSVSYDKLNFAYSSVSAWSDGTYGYPLYLDGSNNMQECSAQDMYDTLIRPAIDTLTSGSTGTAQAGTYRIHTATSLSGHTLISSTPVFVDTRANAGAYSAAGLPETQDQPTTITNYYLMRVNAASQGSFVKPLVLAGSGVIHEMPATNLTNMLQDSIQYNASQVSGTKISYNINGSGNARGSAMVDTRLNSSTYLTDQQSDNYRSQEVPSGSAATISTYTFKITQV
jgi:hypothetical protein